ncbi:MAG: recombination mediator RecR [Gammaproteobacteria bacterium]
MSSSPLLERFIDALQCLPGVGKKSAQRIAFQLLQRDRESALKLADVMRDAMSDIGQCKRCRTFSESSTCGMCNSQKRDHSLLCVVENPLDVSAITQSSEFRGVFFVLMGHLSPIDGITPAKLGMDLLKERLAEGDIKEMIVATGTTMEGEATAHYLKELASDFDIVTSRIAFGVPVGGELEYLDSSTLSLALSARREY